MANRDHPELLDAESQATALMKRHPDILGNKKVSRRQLTSVLERLKAGLLDSRLQESLKMESIHRSEGDTRPTLNSLCGRRSTTIGDVSAETLDRMYEDSAKRGGGIHVFSSPQDKSSNPYDSFGSLGADLDDCLEDISFNWAPS